MKFGYFLEVCLFSAVNFFPCFLFALLPFRDRLRHTGVKLAAVIFLNAAIHTGLLLLKPYTNYNGILSMFCTAIHGLFLVWWIDDHWGKSIYTLLIMTNISNFIMVASKCLEGLLFPAMAAEHFHWTNALTMVIVDLAVLPALLYFFRKFYIQSIRQKVFARFWSYLWLIPLTFYAVWFRNFYFSQEGALTLSLRPRHVLFSLIINCGALLTYFMVANLINEHTARQKLEQREHQLTLQHTQYTYLQDRIEEARRAKHDTRQHLRVISAYLQEQKYAELEAYLSRYSKTMPAEEPLTYCENFAVNALLQYFAGYAKIIGTGFSAIVQLPNDAGIPDEELTVVIGNLLENAIEACTCLGSGSLISIRVKQDENVIFCKLVNSCPEEPKRGKDGRYLSRKRQGYGIGLSSVETIATRHSGIMKAHWEDGKFIVSVLLNMDT